LDGATAAQDIVERVEHFLGPIRTALDTP
jgi:hypothetical protein